MKPSFSAVIHEALQEIEYSGKCDNKRLLAAIQDLATDYPREKKFLNRNADEMLLQICCEAISCEDSQITIICEKVSQYAVDRDGTILRNIKPAKMTVICRDI